MPWRGERALRDLRGWLLPAIALGAWELVARAGLVSPYVLPRLSSVIGSIAALAADGTAARHVAVSAVRVTAGFSLGALTGAALGLLAGLSRRAEAYLDPALQMLRSIPALAWVPLLLLWFGIGEPPKIILIALGAFFPLYVNLLSGVRAVDPKWLELGRAAGFDRRVLVRRIVLPSVLPPLLAGLRTANGIAWLYVVAAELIAAQTGLGFMLTDGRELSRPDLVFAAIVLLAICGKASDGVLKSVERHCLAWRPDAVEAF
jgi:sulfonate transport system permease protein